MYIGAGNQLRVTTWVPFGQYQRLLDRHILWRRRATLRKLSRGASSRLEWMIWFERHDENALATARHYGITGKTFWKWKKRFNEQNLLSLEERSRTPLRRRSRVITEQEETRIVLLRKEHLRWGKEKIALVYAGKYRSSISAWKVQKTIEKYRLYYNPRKNQRIQTKRARAATKRRIAMLRLKNRAGFLFRIDSVVRYWFGTKRYILTAVDSASRLAFARMYTSHSSRAAADFLCRLHLLVNGKIENVQTDNGSEFHGEFEVACKELNVEHYWSRVKTPKDNAGNERFNRTLSEEFIEMGNMTTDTGEFNRRLTDWLIEYNFTRPHQALDYSTPINFIHKHSRPPLLPMYPSSTRP